ncbi:MAG: hypothetical protein ABSC94_01545 [Polyangiaceae bacterium]|jgi:hypothetical protein
MTFVPAFWCDPLVATAWLEAHGWTIEGLKAVKEFRSTIPAPRANAIYDLYDIAFEERVAAHEIVERILIWAARADVAGDTRHLAPPAL